MTLAMLLCDFEALDSLVKPVHLRQNISAVQTDRRDSEEIVGIRECLLSAIVVRERFGIFVQPVIQIS